MKLLWELRMVTFHRSMYFFLFFAFLPFFEKKNLVVNPSKNIFPTDSLIPVFRISFSCNLNHQFGVGHTIPAVKLYCLLICPSFNFF